MSKTVYINQPAIQREETIGDKIVDKALDKGMKSLFKQLFQLVVM